MRRLPAIAICTVSILFIAAPSRAVQQPDVTCSVAKMKAASTSLSCYLRRHLKIATGELADPSDCTEKVTASFARAESRGGCLTTGDASIAAGRSEQTAIDILDSFGAGLVADKVELVCVKRKLKLVTRYARCQTSALTTRVTGAYQGLRNDFDECRDVFETVSAEIDAGGGCPTTGEALDVEDLAPGAFAFLPGIHIAYANLDYAPLSHAYLVGVDFFQVTAHGASFHGADLSDASFYVEANLDVGRPPADFRDATFDGATVGSNLTGSRFAGAELGGAALSVTTRFLPDCPASLPPGWSCMWGYLIGPHASVSGLDLSGLDISGMSFAGVRFYGLNLESAIVHGVDFTDAYIDTIYVGGADLAGTDFSTVAAMYEPVTDAPLVACPSALWASYLCHDQYIIGYLAHLTGADFSGDDLSGLNMPDQYLTACNLSGTNLAAATLIGTHFTDCDLSDADVTGATLYSAYWSNTICPDHTNSNSNGNTCCGHFVGGAPLTCM